MRVALYQPDIPQNTGAILRLAACFGVPVDVIEPAGFVLSDARMRRAGMDYIDHVELARHASWARYVKAPRPGRLVLLTTRGDTALQAFALQASDTLLLGRESAGVPEDVHAFVDTRVRLPIRPEVRSLNVAMAAAIALHEALRQTGGLPGTPDAV